MEKFLLQYDLISRKLFRDGDEILLRAKEKGILDVLINSSPEHMSREALCDAIWDGRHVSDFTINQTINSLRKKIGDSDKELIQTIPRKGYAIDVRYFEMVDMSASAGLRDGFDSEPYIKTDIAETNNKRKNLSVFHKSFRRSIIIIALFIGAVSAGVGVSALKGIYGKSVTHVYVDGTRFDIYENRVEYKIGGGDIICELIARGEGDFISGKTACRQII
ncbi:winged helix-turn-helix domain-containing protein [Enterobacter sp. 22325]|uniref:winged helix-turn-helix domain-containing protein n=1 Tax=Enterobacter sp. 22325 TaxID=3453911 RepID=UPI003F8500D0